MSRCAQPIRPVVIDCPAPVLTIGFPATFPGPGDVVLANGAVVNLEELGEIISTFCPAFACPPAVQLPFTGRSCGC